MKWIALAKARGMRCNLLDSTGSWYDVFLMFLLEGLV